MNKPMDRSAELAALVRERFGDPADVAREGTQPPPLTDTQRAHNRQSLKGWK